MYSITAVCIVDNCSDHPMAERLCRRHYGVKRKYGDPTYVLLGRGCAKKHGFIFMLEYRVWSSMKSRCLNKNHHAYKDYGGRGITVCDRWLAYDGFENFILDMDWRPTSDYSLDRINNSGNYEPSNCRWALRSIQQGNRRKSRLNTSGYIGVFMDKTHPDKWFARIEINYKPYNLGRFIDSEQAAIEYDKAVIFFRGYDGVTNIIPNDK